MRVCVLIPVLDAFKGGNHLPLLAACSGIQFTILTHHTKPDKPELPPNVTVETLGGRLGPYYYGVSEYLFARSVLRKHPIRDPFWKQFTVIHLNQTMGPALRKLRRTGVPVALFIHHPVTADLQIALEESPKKERTLWVLKYFFLRRWQKRLCQLFPIATVSRTAAERIASDYGISPVRITSIPNGVDLSLYVPADTSVTEYDVIAVGSYVHPRKGFRYLLEAYRLLSSQGLRIADVGRRKESQRLELALIPGVMVYGTIDDATLRFLLPRSGALISTSLYEGFGLSIIEALACGRPAFAFAGGAIPEVLSSIDPHLIIPLRDTAELVRRVRGFLALPLEKHRQKAENYRKAVLERYTLEKSAMALQAFYKRVSITGSRS